MTRWSPGTRVSLVLFDLDGTLSDSAPGITSSMRTALTRILWSLRRSSNNDDGETPAANAAAASAPLATRSVWKAYRIGLVTNVANPKALVFFGALLASIVPHGSPLLAQLEVFATIVGVAFAWFASLAWIASGERVANGYRRAARRIDGAVGGVFTVIGVSLAAKA